MLNPNLFKIFPKQPIFSIISSFPSAYYLISCTAMWLLPWPFYNMAHWSDCSIQSPLLRNPSLWLPQHLVCCVVFLLKPPFPLGLHIPLYCPGLLLIFWLLFVLQAFFFSILPLDIQPSKGLSLAPWVMLTSKIKKISLSHIFDDSQICISSSNWSSGCHTCISNSLWDIATPTLRRYLKLNMLKIKFIFPIRWA